MSRPQLTLKLMTDKELIRKLERLDGRLRGSIARKAMRAASAPVIAAERQTAPVDLGNLRQSITKKIRTKAGRTYAVIGPAVPEGAHAHLVESGTKERFTASGASRGSVTGVKWMERAFNQSAPQAIKEIEQKIKEGLATANA